MTKQKQIAAIIGATVSSLALIVACRDNATSPNASERASPAVSATSTERYSPEQLHAINRMDWVGRGHNDLVRALAGEMKKGKSFRELCNRLTLWLDAGKLEAAVPQASASARSEAKRVLLASPLCKPREARAFRSVSRPGLTEDPLSSAATALLADIESETGAASGPTDLASRLSPIVSSASSLGDEEDVVLTAVSIAQNSYELWWDTTELAAMAAPYEADMDPCLVGQMENQQYEFDGDMYQCQGSEWLLIHDRRRQTTKPTFTLVAAVTVNCGPWFDGSAVTDADLGAGVAGLAAVWMSGAWAANPPAAAGGVVAASGMASTLSGIGRVWSFLRCKYT